MRYFVVRCAQRHAEAAVYVRVIPPIGRTGLFLLSKCTPQCPMSTATNHIGSNVACSGGQRRFGLVLVDGLGQSKAVPVSYPKPIIPLLDYCFALSSARRRSGYAFNQWPSCLNYCTHLLSIAKIQALLRAFYTMRCIDYAKGWLRRTPLFYHIRKVITCKSVLRQ